MSEITYTDGTKVIFNTWHQCDCGLTGGCEKCQPVVYTPEMQQEDIELAEVGMEEYRKGLERDDMDKMNSVELQHYANELRVRKYNKCLKRRK